jgi:hypothetical protein
VSDVESREHEQDECEDETDEMEDRHLSFSFPNRAERGEIALPGFGSAYFFRGFTTGRSEGGVGTGTHTQTHPPSSAKYDIAQNPGCVPPAPAGGRFMGLEIDPVSPPGGFPGGVGQTCGGGSGGMTIGCVGNGSFPPPQMPGGSGGRPMST